MDKKTEALKLALEALEYAQYSDEFGIERGDNAITALREALAEQPAQQELVACAQIVSLNDTQGVVEWLPHNGATLKAGDYLYTPTPAQRKPLTDEEKDAARWRFLVDNSFDKEGITQFHVWEHSWEPHSQTGEPTEWKQRVGGPALDRFIDLAIEAAHGIKGDA